MAKAFAFIRNNPEGEGFTAAGGSDHGLGILLSREQGRFLPAGMTVIPRDFSKIFGLRLGEIGVSAIMHPDTPDGATVSANHTPDRRNSTLVSVQFARQGGQPIVNGVVVLGDTKAPVVITADASLGGIINIMKQE